MKKNDPRALTMGVAVYVIWGFFPLYFALLAPAAPLEVIVHRAAWSLLFCLLTIVAARRLPIVRSLLRDRGAVMRLALAGILIVINWATYVYAVQSGHTSDAAIGYFINPLITVALALIVLRERISRMQKVALTLGTLAVIVLIVGQGTFPLVPLTLAFTFGLYSLVKKDVAARVDPLAGMAVETGAVLPALLIYYGYLVATSSTSFHALISTQLAPLGSHWAPHLLLLIGSGALTLIPLVMFASAARGLTLGTMGFLQYVGPTLQLLVAVFAFHEAIPTPRWVAMGIVWLALACLSTDWVLASIRERRKQKGTR